VEGATAAQERKREKEMFSGNAKTTRIFLFGMAFGALAYIGVYLITGVHAFPL